MKTLALENVSLAYDEHGQGEPVVLVHGSVSDYRTWQGQWDALASDFRVIVYSRRYHWPNEPIPDDTDYSMLQQVDDLEALLRNLDIAPAHLVGNSYGAYLCLLLALRHPELARSLVLAEPPVLPLVASVPPKLHELFKLLVTRPRTAAAVMKFGAGGIAPATAAFKRGDTKAGIDAFGRAVFGRERYEQLPEERVDQNFANAKSAKAELLGSGFAALDPEELKRLNVPVLLITGGDSVALFHRLAERLEECLPPIEKAIIPGASHRMHEEQPDDFNDIVHAFLAKHRHS